MRTVDIPAPRFFGTSGEVPEFGPVLIDAIDRRGTLSFRLSGGQVRLLAEDGDDDDGPVLLGRWRSPDMAMLPLETMGSRILTPFLFDVTGIRLHHSQIFTGGQGFRSIADFFLRNMLMAITQGMAVTCQPDANPMESGAGDSLRELRRQYLYLLRAIFADPAFEGRNVPETVDFLLANAYLPLLHFSDPLLQQGADALRAACREQGAEGGRRAVRAKLMGVRERMMGHFA